MLNFVKETSNIRVLVIPQISVTANIRDSNGRWQEVLKLGYICSKKSNLSSTCFTGKWEQIESQAEAQSLAVKAFNVAHENSFCKDAVMDSLKKIGFHSTTSHK